MYSITLMKYINENRWVVNDVEYTMTELPKRGTSYKANIWKESAHSSVIGVLMLITIVMIMGGVVALMVATQSMPDKVPMAYLGIAKYNDGVELINKAGDTLTNSSVKILVDGIDRTAEFQAQENTPGWGTLKPGERLYYKSPVEPESVQIVYASNSGQYLLASSESTINTPMQVGISSTAATSAIQYQSMQATDAASAPKAQFTSNTTQGGSPLAVQFTDQSTGTAPMTYHWDFSDGEGNLAENSMQNPVWRFWEDAGTSYTVTLTVTNAYGSDTITKTNYITLGDTSSMIPPVAAFSSSVQNGAAPLTVKFYDQSVSTGVTSYAWNINNDSTIDYTVRNPSHTFTTAGNYTVKLIVTNTRGSDSEIKTSFIQVTSSGSAPKAQFTSNTTQGGSPLTVQFTDQSTGTSPMTYHWDFSDGTGNLAENSMQNPVWRFWEDAGTSYTVTLTVTNAYGSDTITKTNYITLGDSQPTTPVAAFTSSCQSGIAPLIVKFTDQSAGAPQTYAWDFTNDKMADSTEKSPSFTYSTAGNYTVNLTIANANGKDSEIKTNYITVSSAGIMPNPSPIVAPAKLPTAQFSASTTSGQAPLAVQFTDKSVSTTATTYQWDVNNDGTTDYTVKNPSHTFTSAGNHTVKLTVTNASGSDSEIKTNYVRVTSSGIAPKAQFTSNTTQGKSPLIVQFTDQSTGTAPVTYHWDFSDGAGNLAENSMKNPVWRFWDNVATSYTVTLTVTNAYGSDTITKTNYITLGATQQATVIPTPTTAPAKLPTAQFAANITQGKFPLAVQFTDRSVSTGTTTYQWDVNNDGTTDYTSKNPSHIYKAAGTYAVKLTVTNASGSDSEIKTGYITTTSTPAVEVTPVSNSAYGAGTTYGGYAIGGGAGYPTYSAATATYVVTTLAQFKSHMVGGSQPAKAGEIVFVPSGTTINFNGNSVVTIPAGVIIASDRGYNGHTGAILKKSVSKGGWTDAMLTAGGNNVRITGIILEGEMKPQDDTSVSESYYLKGVTDFGYSGFVVDNCEVRGWSYAGIFVDGCPTSGRPWIHHNYIHHNQARGEGYGVNVNGGDLLTEANIFDYNRHSITGGGLVGEKYEFRYNIHLGHGMCIGGVHVDVHENEHYASDRVACAGTYYLIHHNTVKQGSGTNQQAFVHIRDVPQKGAYIYNNLINTNWGSGSNRDGAQLVIYQTPNYSHYFGRVYATNNMWKGTLYKTNTGIVWNQG